MGNNTYTCVVTDANGCFSNLILDLTEPDELTVRLQFPGDSTTVNAGDEVIVPPYTMSACAAAILACSAVPVFVDVDADDFCIDAQKM